jgi:hypothetical protein
MILTIIAMINLVTIIALPILLVILLRRDYLIQKKEQTIREN